MKNQTYPVLFQQSGSCRAKSLEQEYAKSMAQKPLAHWINRWQEMIRFRFDMIFQPLFADIEIITPIRDLKLSRQEEIDTLKKHGVEMNCSKSSVIL